MTHKHCYEAVDRMLRDFMQNDLPFGGKVVVMAGDFRQILPVVRRGTQTVIVGAAICESHLWNHFKVLELTENMRVQRLLAEGRDVHEQSAFASLLLEVGEGRTGDPMKVPEHMLAPSSDPKDLIDWVLGDLAQDPSASSPDRLIHRAILTPKNDDVDAINGVIMDRLPGDLPTFNSADTMSEEDDAQIYPPEFLNSLQPQGMPPHMLGLKKGAPIILLRNLNPAMGLANGTRLIVIHMTDRLIQAEIDTGTHVGTSVRIPRTALTPSDNVLPFTFTRRQFPIRPAFALTVNKAQGQTFKRVGVFLPRPVFSHGQLNVAMSRVGEPSGVRVMLAHDKPLDVIGVGYTPNIVYSEEFRNLRA